MMLMMHSIHSAGQQAPDEGSPDVLGHDYIMPNPSIIAATAPSTAKSWHCKKRGKLVHSG
jgi:hypothetical protein